MSKAAKRGARPRISVGEFAAARARMAGHAIPELIGLLESDDLQTRFLAEMCLRDATGT